MNHIRFIGFKNFLIGSQTSSSFFSCGALRVPAAGASDGHEKD
jgi:hypothetical protein